MRELLPNEHVRVNLIRYHMVPGIEKLRTSSDERMTYFRDYLNGKGVTCTIRRSRGEDIAAACGQLAGQVRKQQSERKATVAKDAKPAKNAKPTKDGSKPSTKRNNKNKR